MIRRKHAIILSLVVPSLALVAGCDDEEKATPQVIFEGVITGSGTSCGDAGNLMTIGTFGNPSGSTPVRDGQVYEQGGVSVSCSVVSVGSGEFDVNASAVLSGATGGLFRIDGRFNTQIPNDQPLGNIQAIFSTRRTGNTYEQADRACTVRYPLGNVQGVAAGRVWAEVTCPSALNSNSEKTCNIVANFRFENCGQ